MLPNSRSLLHRTASAIGWWTSSDWPQGEAAPLPHTLETLAETAVAGGYSAGISLGFCPPIKSPSTAAFGHANLETGTAADEDSLFRIGACTRQMTAAAILLLVEQSRLRLTDRVDALLPGEPDTDAVYVGDLLLGEGAAYARLGRIVERVTGQIFADFVTDTLLLPAGMIASRFAHPSQIMPHRAAGYRLAADRTHDFRNAGAGHVLPAADGLYATAGDLLLWNRALHNGRLLAHATVEMMVKPAAEGSPCPTLEPFLERPKRGFGMETARLFGRRAFWQHGQAPGFDAWLFHFPDDRADLALLANTEQGAATILEPVLRAILRV
jgi:CubicO group peptidase (beta-lactamase class C family)